MSYPDVFNLERATRTSDGKGGHTEEFSIIKPEVRARVRPASTGEKSQASKVVGVVTHVVMFPPGIDVKRGDRFTAINGPQVLRVKHPPSRPSKPRYFSALCEEEPIDDAAEES